MPSPSDLCAQEVLEVVPLVMRTVRTEMRRYRAADLSVPQFRVLGFLDGQPGASLSTLAEHIGLTLPSLSSLVNGLVKRKLLARETDVRDRRRLTLTLTARGASVLAEARRTTQVRLGEKLAALSPSDQAVVVKAMQVLRPVFIACPPALPHHKDG